MGACDTSIFGVNNTCDFIAFLSMKVFSAAARATGNANAIVYTGVAGCIVPVVDYFSNTSSSAPIWICGVFVGVIGTSYRQHTSCISEAEKYEKALYKGPKKNNQKPQPVKVEKTPAKVEEVPVPTTEPVKKKAKKESKKESKKDLKKESPDSSPLLRYLNSNKQEGFYKVIKKLSKDNSKDIKDILKTLKVTKTEDGKIIIE
ncbi:hypothetical protein DFJ63DRAFT_337246 [Scheffersomyces coipomensis]|uniref:uncharacterized protein n=1 Tax=Scheffersomyces coipomensis TaxID=1788519 RepID=UPI00315C5B92